MWRICNRAVHASEIEIAPFSSNDLHVFNSPNFVVSVTKNVTTVVSKVKLIGIFSVVFCSTDHAPISTLRTVHASVSISRHSAVTALTTSPFCIAPMWVKGQLACLAEMAVSMAKDRLKRR